MSNRNFTNSIGMMIMKMREEQGISQQILCKGICSQKMMSRYEAWTNIPDRLSLNLILQRLGKSPDHFVTVITQKEYQYLQWKREVIIALQENDAAVRNHRIKKLFEAPQAKDRTCHKGLQEQFCQYVIGYINQDADKMKAAIMITVPDYDEGIDGKSCISSMEMNYILIYLKVKSKKESVKKELKRCIDYIEQHITDEEEKMKVYPKAVCLYCLYLNKRDVFERITYCKKALSLLTGNGRIQEVPRLLEMLGYDLDQICPEEAKTYRLQLWALQEVYKTYHMEINRSDKHLEEFTQDIFLLNEILKTYREEKGLNREETSEDICDPNSYGRVESGSRDIKKSNYDKLAERLGIPYGKYSSMLVTDNYECLTLARQATLASKFGDWDSLEKIIQKQKELLDIGQIRNRQYILEKENLLLDRRQEITCEQFQKNAVKALRMTIPKWDEQKKIIHFYSNEEITLVNQIAIAYRRQNKPAMGIHIIENVYETLEKSAVDLTERADKTLLLLATWKDLLTDLEEYDKAMEKAEMGVELALKSERGDKLDTFVFEKGWSSLKKGNVSAQQKKEYLNVCNQAYYICDLYGREFNKKATKKFIEQYGGRIME